MSDVMCDQLDPSILKKIKKFRDENSVDESVIDRVSSEKYNYYGKDVWKKAVIALLSGANLLLVGNKSTGKNVLAGNLAYIFGRPMWNISLHVNMDAAALIGTDTFKNNEVVFRPGPVYECAVYGGFGVLDEINMAKNEALAVLHSILDHRRIIDVPGYDRIALSPATRFIGTMNYGYAGTRELNEALLSRFVVIDMPLITEDSLEKLILDQFPNITSKYLKQFTLLFMDLQKKCQNAELSEKCLDLRGLLDGIKLTMTGLDVISGLEMGVINKSFSQYEKTLMKDLIDSRIPKKSNHSDIFKM